MMTIRLNKSFQTPLQEDNTSWVVDCPGLPTHVASGPKVVAMTTFQGRGIVAREDGVFWLDGDVLRKMEIAE